jgi:hypothetical protein
MSDEMAWEHGLRSVPCGEEVPDAAEARAPRAREPSSEGARVDAHGSPLPERRLPDVVSVLAGEPWADWPSRVHPTLVAVAWGVHEHSSRAGRASLLPLAPALVDTARRGFETSARVVATCVSTALASPLPERITEDELDRLREAHGTARHLLARCTGRDGADQPDHDEDDGAPAPWWVRVPGPATLVEPVYRRFAAPDAVALAVAVAARACDADRDRRLRRLLRWCVAQATACGGPGTGSGRGDAT